MAAIKRRRTFAASPTQVWRVVANPKSQTDWWPDVERVEAVSAHGFTQVLRSSRGTVVRADFLRASAVEPSHLVWTQQLEGTPFASVFRNRAIAIELRPGEAGTEVVIAVDQTLCGAARLVPLNRGGVKRQLEAALAALEQLLAG
jgi:uncharacterized protein YndB with AHSA1/START domain